MSSECLRATFLLPILVTLLPFLVAGGSVWAHLRRPAWAGLPTPTHPLARRLLALAPYALIFGAVLAMGFWKVSPHWRMQNDEERDHLMALLCATGRACPLVGNEMNRLRVQLGPLNRYLMAALNLVSRDPRATLVSVMVCHALAAAWAARLADSLFRAPAGLAVALLLGTHPVLLESCIQPSNGSWVVLPLVATVALTLRWLRGDGGVPLVGAVTALTCAMQLHGTAMELAPIALALGLIYRPRTPRWALYASAAVVAVMYLPWLWFQFISDWSGFRAFSLSWLLSGGSTATQGGPPPSLGARLLAPFVSLGPAALLLAPGMASLWPGRDPQRRGLLAFAAVPLAISLVGAATTGGMWADRYCMVFLPAVTLAAFGWVRLAWAWQPRAAWALVPVVPLACAWAAAENLRQYLPRALVIERSRVQVSLAEDIEAVRLLASHGFRNQDLDRLIHGTAWARWTSGRTYLGRWIIGPRSTPAPAERVLVTGCAVHDPAFARWQHMLTRGPGLRHHLVGYRPSLEPARLEVDLGDGPPWTLDDGLPFFMEQMHAGDSRLRRMVDPVLAYPVAFEMLNTRWMQRRGPGPGRMRAVTRLTRCEGERYVTVLATRSHVPTFTVGGVARAPDETQESVEEVRYRIRPTPAECAAAPIEVVAEMELPPMAPAPRRIDLYEEPYPACPEGR